MIGLILEFTELPDKGLTIKGLVVFNRSDIDRPLDLLNGLALNMNVMYIILFVNVTLSDSFNVLIR